VSNPTIAQTQQADELTQARKRLAELEASETQLRATAQALHASEERFRTSFDHAAIGKALVSPDGGWLKVNRALCEIVGYPEGELLTKTFQDLTHPDDLEADLAYVEQMLRGETDTYQMEKRYFHKDGHIVWVLLSVSLVWDPGGKPVHFISGIQDITARKQAEESIRLLNADLARRAAELEAANRELESFSYSVSHDLRAPLRSVNSFAKILLEEHADELSAEARHYLEVVSDSGKQMGALVDDLLAFSRLGKQPLNKETVTPLALVSRALEDLREEQRDRRVDFSVGNLPTCQADPTLLKQVFVNLLDNALKFTRTRKRAVVEVGAAPMAAEASPRSNPSDRSDRSDPSRLSTPVVYFVKDNGVGFDMQYADRLFGVFQRLHRAEEFEGTGVGLAIVQRVIHRHGGRVWAEAEVDRGATFYFTIPGPKDG
jgi:PAS domain S-box-containing protein